MNEAHIRGRIITYTMQQIRWYGIRNIRMDDIAKELGISKRTLYCLFTDKKSLVKVCLKIFSENGRRLLQRNPIYRKDVPISDALHVVNSYITTIYQISKVLLEELDSDITYRLTIDQEKYFWNSQLTKALEKCKSKICPVIENDTEQLSANILQLFYLNCINGNPYQSQLQIGYVFLKGLVYCDSINDMDNQVKHEWNKLLTILQNWERL